jgi:hypothetical protein
LISIAIAQLARPALRWFPQSADLFPAAHMEPVIQQICFVFLCSSANDFV